MSKTKHTKGPWIAEHFTVRAGDTILSDSDCEQEQCDECEANAQLIAAAPDLLRELEESVEAIQEYFDTDWNGESGIDDAETIMENILLDFKKAIKKAKGE